MLFPKVNKYKPQIGLILKNCRKHWNTKTYFVVPDTQSNFEYKEILNLDLYVFKE